MTAPEHSDPARRTALERLARLPAGTRVTVRYALPTGDASGKGRTDAIGTLRERSDDDLAAVVLDTRGGPVRIPLADVRLARQVPPPAPRR